MPGEEFVAAQTQAPPTATFLELTRTRLAATDPTRHLSTKAIGPAES